MTRKEKKEELIGLFSVGAIYIGDLIDECFEFGQQHPRWISVEDELPRDSGGFYLSVDDNGEIWFRQYTKLYGWRAVVGNFLISGINVTHWMPLPSIENLKKGDEE